MTVSIVYVTAPDEEEARRITRLLVEESLVACGNIIPGMISVYRWQGAVAEESEVSLILKTETEKVPVVIARIAEIHPYECPCAISWPLASGHPAFVDWVVASVGNC